MICVCAHRLTSNPMPTILLGSGIGLASTRATFATAVSPNFNSTAETGTELNA